MAGYVKGLNTLNDQAEQRAEALAKIIKHVKNLEAMSPEERARHNDDELARLRNELEKAEESIENLVKSIEKVKANASRPSTPGSTGSRFSLSKLKYIPPPTSAVPTSAAPKHLTNAQRERLTRLYSPRAGGSRKRRGTRRAAGKRRGTRRSRA